MLKIGHSALQHTYIGIYKFNFITSTWQRPQFIARPYKGGGVVVGHGVGRGLCVGILDGSSVTGTGGRAIGLSQPVGPDLAKFRPFGKQIDSS